MPRKRRRDDATTVLDEEQAEAPETGEEETVDLPGSEQPDTDESPEDPFENKWSEELEELARDYMWLWFQQWTEEMSDFQSKWKNQWELYLNKSRLQRYVRVHGMNVYVPRSFILTETIAPRIAKAIFGADRWFSHQSIMDKDRDGAEMSEALQYWNADHNRWKARGTDWIRMGCIHGFGVIKIDYRRRRVRVPTRKGKEEPVTDASGREIGKKTRLQSLELDEHVDEYVRWRIIPPHAYFQSNDDISPQDARNGAGDEYCIDYQELLEGEEDGYYINVKRLMQGLVPSNENEHLPGLKKSPSTRFHFGWDTAWWNWQYKQARDVAAGESPSWRWSDYNEDGNPEFTVRCVQRRFPFDGKDKPWIWCELHMVGPFLIRCCPNMNPLGTTDYHLVSMNPMPGKARGQGVIQPNLSLMIQENEIRNHLFDASDLRVRPMALVEHGVLMPGTEWVWKSGGRMDVRYKGGIGWTPPIPNMAESVQQAAICEQLQKDCAGSSAVMMGGSEPGRQTAGEVSTQQFEGNIRHAWAAEMIELDSVKGALEHSLALHQTHMTVPRIVRILGVRGWTYTPVSPEQIMGRYEVRLRTATETSQSGLAVTQANNFLVTAGNLAPLSPDVMTGVNYLKVLKSIASVMATPGHEEWFNDKKKSGLNYWQEVQTFRVGGRVELDADDDAITRMAYLKMPGQATVDPLTGAMIPGPSIEQEFLDDPEIDPTYKDTFQAWVFDVAAQAQTQMFQSGMVPGMPGMPPAGGIPGQPPGPGGPSPGGPGQPPEEPKAPAGSPQEMPRSMEAVQRMGGQMPVSTPMRKGNRFNGAQ